VISPVTSIAPDLRPASTASTGAQQEYRSAQAFERILLGQLTKAMQATVPTEDDSDSAATKTYTDMLPDQMADALSANGGIGLASDLLRSLRTNGS
jgi:Rod binding domain-containing protein